MLAFSLASGSSLNIASDYTVLCLYSVFFFSRNDRKHIWVFLFCQQKQAETNVTVINIYVNLQKNRYISSVAKILA